MYIKRRHIVSKCTITVRQTARTPAVQSKYQHANSGIVMPSSQAKVIFGPVHFSATSSRTLAHLFSECQNFTHGVACNIESKKNNRNDLLNKILQQA